jgi:hypothetical protein
MAAAVLKSFDLDEIIFYYEKYLLPPGHPEAQIRNKIFRAWVCHPCLPASAAFIEADYFLRLTRQISPGVTSISMPTFLAKAFHNGMHHL